MGAVQHPRSRRRRVHLGLRVRVRPGYGSPGRIARSRRAQAFPRRRRGAGAARSAAK
jgi:hypothetical protein